MRLDVSFCASELLDFYPPIVSFGPGNVSAQYYVIASARDVSLPKQTTFQLTISGNSASFYATPSAVTIASLSSNSTYTCVTILKYVN